MLHFRFEESLPVCVSSHTNPGEERRVVTEDGVRGTCNLRSLLLTRE